MSSSSLSFQPSCPSGGSWYACGNGVKFVGCCTTNPCTSSGCPSSSLKPASFLASAYGTFPNQECTSGKWYSCSTTTPTFFGCCASNPCQSGGCPSQDLKAGQLSNDPTIANKYNPSPPLSGSSSSSSSSLSSSTRTSSSTASSSTTSTRTSSRTSSTGTSSSTTSSQTTSSTATAVPVSDQASPMPPGAIAGAAAGGLLVLVILVSAVIFVWQMRRHTKKKRNQAWVKPAEKQYEPLSQRDSGSDPASNHDQSYPLSRLDNSHPVSHADYSYPAPQADYGHPASHADYSYPPPQADNSYRLHERQPLSVHTPPPVPVARSSLVSPARSPDRDFHGAAPQDPSQYVAFSPARFSAPAEPRYDTLSGVYSVPDTNVRGVRGNSDYRRAELG